jgi:hypothetical protein
VWKSSRELGIGRSKSSDGSWFVVANFFPAGNYVGRNAENVFPSRDAKSSALCGNQPSAAKVAAKRKYLVSGFARTDAHFARMPLILVDTKWIPFR